MAEQEKEGKILVDVEESGKGERGRLFFS